MKKTLLAAAAVLLLSSQAHAQTCGQPIPQGTWEIAGGSRLNYNHFDVEVGGDEIANYETWGIHLDSAYYFWDNIALGAFLAYDGREYDPEGPGGTYTSDSTLVGPEIVWNFCAEERLWRPFSLYMKLGGGWADANIEGIDVDGWGWVFDAGIKVFLHRALSLNIYYEYQYLDLDDDTTFSGSGVGIGLSVYRIGY